MPPVIDGTRRAAVDVPGVKDPIGASTSARSCTCITSGPRRCAGTNADAAPPPNRRNHRHRSPPQGRQGLKSWSRRRRRRRNRLRHDRLFQRRGRHRPRPAGGGRAAVVPDKATAAPLPVAVGRGAACCRPRRRAIASDGSQCRQALRGGNGRQRQRRARSPPRWHGDKIKKCNKCMGSAPY